jgi:hypothetical protein
LFLLEHLFTFQLFLVLGKQSLGIIGFCSFAVFWELSDQCISLLLVKKGISSNDELSAESQIKKDLGGETSVGSFCFYGIVF